MKNLLMLQNICSPGANYDYLIINVRNIFKEVPFIALTETCLKPISNLSTFCQDDYKFILTCSRQRGKVGGVAIICSENTGIQTFNDTNIPELQILTVKLPFPVRICSLKLCAKLLN